MKTQLKLTAVTIAIMLLAALAAVQQPARAAGPWYVASGGSNGNDCLSPVTACASINGALVKPGFAAGDTLLVASGTYTSNTYNVVVLTSTVTVLGGWNDTFTSRTGISTLDGQGLHQVLWVAYGITATLDYIAVQNGYVASYGGGGIINQATLTLSHSLIAHNKAFHADGGGIHNNGTLHLDHTDVSANIAEQANGGGIINEWFMDLVNSAVHDNRADSGGGIQNASTLTVTNSTISRNSATYTGGGIFNSGYLGLNSSTLSDNRVTAQGGTGGGLVQNGGGAVQNSIIANNTLAGSPSDCASSTSIASTGYNLIGSTAGCSFVAVAGDLLNVDPQLSLLLGSPAYQPLRSTSPAIDAGNPGGCTGSSGILTQDQRDASRVGRCDIGAFEYHTPGAAAGIVAAGGSGQRTSPGTTFAAPLQAAVLDNLGSPVSNVTVTFSAPGAGATGVFANSGTNTTNAVSNGGGIATAAPFAANGMMGSYPVTATASGAAPGYFALVNGGWYVAPAGLDTNDCQSPAAACALINSVLTRTGFASGGTVLVASGNYTGSSDPVVFLNVDANLSGGWDSAFTLQNGSSVINGGTNIRGIRVYPGVTAIVDHFTVQNANFSGTAGGIYSNGNLTLNHSSIKNNMGSDVGGIYSDGILTLNDSSVSGNLLSNSTLVNVGGIANGGNFGSQGTLFVNRSDVSGNMSAGIGTNGNATIISSTILHNGTGIGNGGSLSMTFSIVADNGGGIAGGGYMTITNSAISRNHSTGDRGGGISIGYGTLSLINSTVSGNWSVNAGAGIYLSVGGSTLKLANSTVSDNRITGPQCCSDSGGAGVQNVWGGTVNVRNSIIAGNHGNSAGQDCRGDMTSAGYNIIGNTTGCTYASAGGDLTNVDPRLFPLIGVPGFHPLLRGSPAVNAANPAGCKDGAGNPLPADERGVARVGRCDIGAYEYDPNNDPLHYVLLPALIRGF